jgi:uncharacterized SAM-binding protein YcdF (DUF218 family)
LVKLWYNWKRDKGGEMFIIQKIISNILISPGIFILGLLLVLIFSSYKKLYKIGRVLLGMIIIGFYLFSIEPIKDMIVQPLEKTYPPIIREKLDMGDCYIVLGGGIYDNAPKSLTTVTGTPSKSAMYRIIEGVKLYKKSPKKIFISGGIVYSGEKSEAEIYKNTMIDLGVPEKDIIIEGKSKTTEENAKFTRILMKEYGYKNGILITSATHLKRAMYIFEKNGVEVIPAPTGYTSRYVDSYGIDSYFPNAHNLAEVFSGIWEYIGLIFYRLK